MPKSKGGFHAARVPAIKEEAKQCDFPWHDVFDAPLLDWLETFSRAHNTVKEIMFAAILPTVSALLGPNTCVKVLETYEEPVNIFLVCLAEPKAGKSQSMRLGCTQPLTAFVEKRVQTELLIQSFTASGMRKHMQTCDGQGIIARDECQRFLKDIIAENKKDSLDATMLVLFHDNSPWFFNSGQERKRKCIEKTGISFLGYSQPNSFLEVYAKMVDRGDGLIDRFLVTVPRANTLSHAEVKRFADKLNNSPVKDLRYIYNQIYAIHHGTQGKVSYTFSPEAEKLFNEHTSSTVAAANAVFNGESQEFIDSKDEKHIIRLSCIIHVLKEAFSNALGTNELSGASAARTGTEGASAAGLSAARTSTPRASAAVTDDQQPTFVISLSSMRGAIAVTKYFAEQRNILSKIATPGSIYKDVEPYKIRQKILLFLSPFCPSRLLYTELKVQAATVHEEMKALEEEGLGHVYIHGNKTVFSKVVPSKVDEEKLRGYNVEKSSFENSFLETNSKISAELFVTFLQKAPNSMEINKVLYPGVDTHS